MRRISFLLSVALVLCLACHGDEHQHGSSTDSSSTDTSATTASAAPAITTAPPAGTGQTVSLGGEATGYLALPQTAAGRKPALVVIHEWWGLDDWIRQQTDRFASQGYVTVAVDLYRGKSATNPDEAHQLMRGLPEDRALADMKAAVAYLASRPDVDPNLIGVAGWCMGGGYALALATAEPRIKATNINYGRLVTDPATIGRINGELLGNFGAEDKGIPAADVKKFDEAAKKAGKASDVKIYDGAGHAFMNPNNKEGYNAEAAGDAWKRIDGFFARTLRANMPSS
jgi:carboxymethylenebutenolidase